MADSKRIRIFVDKTKQMKNMSMKTFGRCFVVGLISFLLAGPMNAQESNGIISRQPSVGIAFNADTNHPIFSGSLRAMLELGNPMDWLGVNVGLGYRGYFDRNPPAVFLRHPTVSDWLLYTNEDGYTKSVRPVGGQIVFPVELQLRLIKVDDDARLFAGCGVEYGLRLYQSQRYADFYGDHIMNNSSLSIYPMVGIVGDWDEMSVSASLYWRHSMRCAFNYKSLYDKEKFDANNFFGFQITVAFKID